MLTRISPIVASVPSLVVALVLLFAACEGGDDPQKDAGGGCTNCLFNQCCSQGICVDGTTPQQCGGHGSPCGRCESGPCVNGTCTQQTCSALTCLNGCCSESGCVSPVGDRACGKGGGACQECGLDQVCEQGECRGSIAASYSVVLMAAMVDHDDCNDDCDIVVLVSLASRSETYTSGDPMKDNDRPEWRTELFTASSWELTNNLLKIEVRDDDLIGHDILGRCQMLATGQNLVDRALASQCGLAQLVSFRFDPIE